MTAAELLTLARAYSDATGLALTTIGQRACASTRKSGGNDKLFVRLAKGRGCNSLSIERAARWFAENWPEDAAWPATVPGGPFAINTASTPGGTRSASA